MLLTRQEKPTMSDGFGICGHKNTFNSKVRCGNWVEDNIGMDLVASRVGMPASGPNVSENKATYLHPKRMDDKASRNCPPIDDVRVEYERRGVPSNVMFGHGMEEAHDPEAGKEGRYGTLNSLMFTGSADPARSDKILQTKKRVGADLSDVRIIPPAVTGAAREKLKKEAREARADSSYQTATSVQSRGRKAGVPKSALAAKASNSAIARASGFTQTFYSGSHVARD